jgi:hypothetical protein
MIPHPYRSLWKSPAALAWYRGLSVDQKIGVKTSCGLLLGMSFEDLRHLFTTLEIISLFHDRLTREGLIP